MNDPLLLSPISRRELLRGALVGGAGLAGAVLIGCGEDEGGTAATAVPTDIATPGGNATITAPGMSWQQIAPAGGGPPARYDHTLATDGASLYVFGGRTPEVLGDLWIYDIATGAWSQNTSSGPNARFGHNSIWDPARSKLVVFGGQAGSDFFDDVWEFDPAQGSWTPVSQGIGPTPRYGAAACLDDAGHMLVTHGFTSEGRFDDTWQFDLASGAWSDISGPAGDRPLERCLIDGVWDQRKRRFLIYGGQSNEAPYMDDLWGWSPEIGWQQVARTPRPSPRNMYAMVYDNDRTAAILFGGRASEGPVGDTWVFSADGETWAEAAFTGEVPTARYGHDMAIAPNGTVYLFGGNDGSPLEELWRLDRT